jgi:conjugal transfer/entry exclusion protein
MANLQQVKMVFLVGLEAALDMQIKVVEQERLDKVMLAVQVRSQLVAGAAQVLWAAQQMVALDLRQALPDRL